MARRTLPRRAYRLAVLCALVSVGGRGRAFDYPEHQFTASLSLALFRTMTCEDDVPAEACARTRQDLLDATFELISTERSCKAEDFQLPAAAFSDEDHASCSDIVPEYAKHDRPDPRYDVWGKTHACLNLADVPALSGDHASSPVNLLWRWFNPRLHDRDQRWYVWSALSAMFSNPSLDEPPEEAREARPDISNFLDLALEHQADRWPLAPADLPTLAELDDAVFALKDRSAHHYRAAFQVPQREAVAERYAYSFLGRCDRHKPARHALAWYTDMHAAALHFANLAKDAGNAQRRFLLGLAGYMELASQHYLQDAVAPGHFVVDALRFTAFSAGTGHDEANRKGLEVTPPSEFCGVFEHPPSSLCNGREVLGTVSLYGDGELATCRGVIDWNATRDWIAALGAISLDEVVHASLRTMGDLGSSPTASCGDVDPTDSLWRRYVGSIDPAKKAALRCIFAWWETDEPMAERFEVLRGAAVWNSTKAVSMPLVPMQRGTAQTIDRTITGIDHGTFDGRGFELGSVLRYDSRYGAPSFGFRGSLTAVQSFVPELPNEIEVGGQLLVGGQDHDGRASLVVSLPWRCADGDALVGIEAGIGVDFTGALIGNVGAVFGVVIVDGNELRATLNLGLERLLRVGPQQDSWVPGIALQFEYQ